MRSRSIVLAILTTIVVSLSAEEKAGDWKPLFDGKSLQGWHSFKKHETPTQGWVIEAGVLHHLAKGGGGDLVSESTYDQFELEWDWKIAPGGNSGVKYFITEERKQAIGHEYQLIDDERHADAKIGPDRTTGALYDVIPPRNAHPHAAGEWNTSRIVVRGKHVEHWLNGTKTVEYDLESEALKKAIEVSKFKDVAGFGTQFKGHILLQDHGDEVWFRNIRIRTF
jgi:hypothetical protein